MSTKEGKCNTEQYYNPVIFFKNLKFGVYVEARIFVSIKWMNLNMNLKQK